MTDTSAKLQPSKGEGRGVRPFLRALKARLLTRFVLMFVLPAIGLFIIWIHAIEPNRLQFRKELVSAGELTIKAPRKALRIMHLSDFNLTSEKAVIRLRKAVDIVAKNQPDLVVLTGDYGHLQDAKLQASAETCLAYLRSIVPVFACLGTQDYSTGTPDPKVLDWLQSTGVHVLRNETKDIIVNGTKIHIIGLGDIRNDFKPNECLVKATNATNQDLTLLLCHNPDALPRLKDYQWNIMFSGHARGGQFQVPFTQWCPFAPVELKEFAAKNLYDLTDGRRLSVTSGVGNAYELRFNCFPEVVLIEVRP